MVRVTGYLDMISEKCPYLCRGPCVYSSHVFGSPLALDEPAGYPTRHSWMAGL